MPTPLTLTTAPLEHPAMDYAFLRQEGIRHLERLAGPLWTDFNAHDPGITILEQLCYALTDLAYRNKLCAAGSTVRREYRPVRQPLQPGADSHLVPRDHDRPPQARPRCRWGQECLD